MISFTIPFVPIFRENKQFWLFRSEFAEQWILGSEFWKSKFRFGISSSKIPGVPIFKQNSHLWLFRPKFAQNGFWGCKFENLNPVSGSTSPRYHVCQFSGKTNNFEFCGLIFGKLPNYVQYFGIYNVEGVPDSRVETEINWFWMGEAWWR